MKWVLPEVAEKSAAKPILDLLEKYGIHILNIHKMPQQLNARAFF